MKTAVEFLLSHIWTSDWVNYTKEEKLKVIEQAKEMEKRQIIDAYNEADTFPQSYLHAENYYSEIFKK